MKYEAPELRIVEYEAAERLADNSLIDGGTLSSDKDVTEWDELWN